MGRASPPGRLRVSSMIVANARTATNAMAPSQEPPRPTLLQITDTHLHAEAGTRLRGVDTLSTLDAVLEHAREDRRWPPDAILATGDIVQDGSRAGYERFRSMLASCGLPVLCVPGNHDDPGLMAEVLAEAPFTVGGTVRLDDWSLLLLDSTLSGEEGGGFGEPRLAALESALRDEAGRRVMICMHHQPVPIGSAWLDGGSVRDGDRLFEILDAHANVRCVIWGHVHQACDYRRGRMRLLGTPSTCMQFRPNSTVFAVDDRPPGMRWFRLDPDGSVETEVDWVRL